DDFRSDQESYVTYYLDFLINLLKVTDIYGVEPLKNIVENTIMKGQYINVRNVYKILKGSEEYNAQQLRIYYENHVKSNRKLVLKLYIINKIFLNMLVNYKF